NILCDPSVPPGNVTLTVKAVPLREVFAYLMRTYDVTYAMMGKTILVGKADPLAKALGREETRAFHIAYANIGKQTSATWQHNSQSTYGPASSPRDGSQYQGQSQIVETAPDTNITDQLKTLFGLTKAIVVDERLRLIYVTARKDQMEAIAKFLDQADHPGQQVMLQARIVEIGDDGKEELESLISRVYKNWWFAFDNNGGMIGYTRINKPGLYDDDANDNRLIKPGGLDLSVVAQNPDLNFLDAGLRALETANKGKVLASPSVVTTDGKAANIALTENVKYISARDQAGNPTYSEERVGPTIDFTPRVGRDRIISLQLTLKTGEITKYIKGGMGEQVPQTSTRSVSSFVRVRNGEPFVVGGLFRDGTTYAENKIPILGDIPLLGELFRNRTSTKVHTEVAMIVIPYILDVPASSVTQHEVTVAP
ncbi:type II secretion system protein GspD, partial [Aminomonas paucivorans]|uniref:type II secretion system protein GspD n=1 Tax=Aminomonas paucivorans TaxID=81412 RepID=UPI003318E3CA